MTSRRRFLRNASALLLATAAAPALAAPATTLEIRTPMAPPEWALLERALLRANAEACEAFFGKGVASLGWAVVADTSPKEMAGVTGGIFNTFGNVAGIVTPIVIGYIVKGTGSFDGALVFVGVHCVICIAAYFLIVGKIQRLELKPA